MTATLYKPVAHFRYGEIGPWKRRALYRVGLAVLAAGEADSEDAAHDRVWKAMVAAGDRHSMENTLALAGMDERAVASHLRQIEEDAAYAEREEERAMVRRSGVLPGAPL